MSLKSLVGTSLGRSQQLFLDGARLLSERGFIRTLSTSSCPLRSRPQSEPTSCVYQAAPSAHVPSKNNASQGGLRLAKAGLTRCYATSAGQDEAKIISTTEEHSPGHNVATIAVSNPRKLNIVNSPLLDELKETCGALSKDANLRAVVFKGAPTAAGKQPSWVGGADIKEMIDLSSSEQARAFIDRIHDACVALRQIPVPVIASIDGFCLGAGLEIAAACDLRVATEKSLFGMPEVKVGIPSVIEAAYLPGLIGMGRTRRLLYLAENIDGFEAERWGFLEKLVSDAANLDAVTQEWVDALVGMGSKAIRSQKVLMQQWEECTVQEGIEAGAKAYAEAFADGGSEPKEFMGKFVNRTR